MNRPSVLTQPATGRVGVALTRDAAGTVATRFAGSADFHATLSWDEAQAATPPCLPAPHPSFRHDLGLTVSACGTRLEIRGTITALTAADLGRGIGRAMRAVGDAAAVSGAVLEMRTLLRAAPRTADPSLVQEIARDLWEAGFRVRFAPCWEPAGDPAVGAESGEDLVRFLTDHARWRIA